MRHLLAVPVLLAVAACVERDVASGDFSILFQRGDTPSLDFAYGSSGGRVHDLRPVWFEFEDGAGMSADGTRLAYPAFHMDPSIPRLTLAALDATGADVVLASGERSMGLTPSWSPDSASVAFSRTVFDGGVVGRSGIFVADAAAGGATTQIDLLPRLEPGDLAAHPSRCLGPVWSPDGRQLAYGTHTGVSVYSFADQTVRALVPAGSAAWTCGPRWSPDGGSIVYVAAGRVMRIASTGASAPTAVASLAGDAGAGAIRWSPDGQSLAFTEAAPGGFAVRRVDATGGDPVTLEHIASEIPLGPAEWSPDGRTLLFSYFEDAAFTAHLAVIDDGGRTTLPLPLANTGYYAWLPAPLAASSVR